MGGLSASSLTAGQVRGGKSGTGRAAHNWWLVSRPTCGWCSNREPQSYRGSCWESSYLGLEEPTQGHFLICMGAPPGKSINSG